MADEELGSSGQANFTEVLEVTVPPESFITGLNELSRIYDEWVAKLGENAQGVIGAGSTSGLREVQEELKNFTVHMKDTFAELATQLDNWVSKVREGQQSLDDRIVQSAEKQAEAQKQRLAVSLATDAEILASSKQLAQKQAEAQTQTTDTSRSSAQKAALEEIATLVAKVRTEYVGLAETIKAVPPLSSPSPVKPTEASTPLSPEQTSAAGEYNSQLERTVALEGQVKEATQQIAAFTRLLGEDDALVLSTDEERLALTAQLRSMLLEILALQERIAAAKPTTTATTTPASIEQAQALVAAHERYIALLKEEKALIAPGASAQFTAQQAGVEGINSQVSQLITKIAAVRAEMAELRSLPGFELKVDTAGVTAPLQQLSTQEREVFSQLTVIVAEYVNKAESLLSGLARDEEALEKLRLTQAQTTEEQITSVLEKEEAKRRTIREKSFIDTPTGPRKFTVLPPVEQRAQQAISDISSGIKQQPKIVPGADSTPQIIEGIRKLDVELGKFGESVRDKLTDTNQVIFDKVNAVRVKQGELLDQLQQKIASLKVPPTLEESFNRVSKAIDEAVAKQKEIVTTTPSGEIDDAAQSNLISALKQELALRKELQGIISSIEGQRKLAQDIGLEQEGLLNKSLAEQRKLAQDIGLEQEGVVNKALEGQRKLAHDIGLEQEGIVNKSLDDQLALEEKITAELKKQQESKRKLTQDIGLEQEGVVNKALADQIAQEERITSQLEKQQQLRLKSESAELVGKPAEQAALWAQRLKEVEAELVRINALRSVSSTGKLDLAGETEITRLTGLQSEAKAKLAAATAKQITLEEQYSAELSKTAAAAEKLASVNLVGNTAAQLDAVIARLARARAEMAQLQATGGLGKTSGITAGDVDNQKKYTAAIGEASAASKEQISLTKKLGEENKGVFASITEEMGGALKVAIKYSLAYGAVFEALRAIKAVILSPFTVLEALGSALAGLYKQGIEYSADLENKSYDLGAVIGANVRYAKDFGENFKLAQQTGVEAMRYLQDKAIALRVDLTQLTGTLRALLEGNGIDLVGGSARKLIDLAGALQVVAKSRPQAGNLSSGALQTALPDLFQPDLKNSNAWLQLLTLTADQWKQIVASSKTSGDILEQLAPKLRNFQDAVEKSQTDLTVLTNQFELLKKRILEVGAEEAFNKLKDLLVFINSWMEQHSTQIADSLQLIARLVADVVNTFVRFSNATGLTASLKFELQNIIGQLTAMATIAASGFDAIATGARIAAEAVKFNGSEILKLWHDLAERNDQRMADFKKGIALASGEPVSQPSSKAPSPLDRIGKGTSVIVPKHTPTSGGGDRSEFTKAKAEFQELAEGVKKNAAEARQALKDLASEGEISYQTAARGIAAIDQKELHDFAALVSNILKAAEAARAKLLQDTPAPKRKQVSEQFDAQTATLKKQIIDSYAAINAATAQADKDAEKERQRIATEGIEDNARKQDILTQHDRDMVREAAADERQTQLQNFDAERQIDAIEHEHRVQLLNAEIAQKKALYGSDTEAYIKLVHDKENLESEYNERLKVYSEERKRIDYEEFRERLRFADEERAAKLSTQQDVVNIQTQVAPPGAHPENLQIQLDQAKELELEQLTRETSALLAVAQAKNAESNETRQLTLRLQELHQQRLAVLQDEIAQKTAGVTDVGARQVLVQGAVRDQIVGLQKQLNDSLDQLKAQAAKVNANPLSADEANKEASLQVQVQHIKTDLDYLNQVLRQATPTLKSTLDSIGGAIFGQDNVDTFQKLLDQRGKDLTDGVSTVKDNFALVGIAAKGLAVGFQNALAAVAQFKQAKEQGGTLGGVGSLLSEGPTGQAIGAIPFAGPIINAVGSVMKGIGDIFVATTKRIASEVQTEFNGIINAYQNKSLSLNATIQAVTQERATAIERLSGKKGGQDQLAKILPEMDQALGNLKAQQLDTITNFDRSLKVLQLHSDTLTQINQQWLSVNDTVKQYIDAGGSAVKATQYLAESLKQIQKQSADELRGGYETAIQDAISLNSLTHQRIDMEKSFKQQEFGLINADSLERTQAGAVGRGQQLQQLREQFQQQMDDLNVQISLTSQKVTAEGKVFKIATDINALHRQDEQLAMLSLNDQLQKYMDIEKFLASKQGGGLVTNANVAKNGAAIAAIDSQINEINKAMEYQEKHWKGQQLQDALDQEQKNLASLQQQKLTLTTPSVIGGNQLLTGNSSFSQIDLTKLSSIIASTRSNQNFTSTVNVTINNAPPLSNPKAVGTQVGASVSAEIQRQARLSPK